MNFSVICLWKNMKGNVFHEVLFEFCWLLCVTDELENKQKQHF